MKTLTGILDFLVPSRSRNVVLEGIDADLENKRSSVVGSIRSAAAAIGDTVGHLHHADRMIDGSSLAAVLAAQLATDRRSFLMNSSFVLLGVALLWLLGWSLQTTLPFGVEIVPQITALMMFFTAAGTLGALFWALMGFAGGVGGKDFIRSDALENAAEICGFGDRAIYLFREGRIQVIRIDAIGSMVIEDRFLRIYSRFGDPSARIIVAEQDVSLMTTVIDRLRSRIA